VKDESTKPEAELPIFVGSLRRIQRGHNKTFSDQPEAPPHPAIRRSARAAVMLALAHKIQAAIDQGVVRNRADVSRRLGLTRARITQLLDLTLLAPDIQEEVLLARSADGAEPLAERQLRYAAKAKLWSVQRQRRSPLSKP
jgi:hypothetical protein